MTQEIPREYTLVEKPIIQTLTGEYGYRYIHPSQHSVLRARENEVLFGPLVVEALMRINGIERADALAVLGDLSRITDNERWLDVLRGKYSRKVAGEDKHRTIQLVDFDNIDNNDFAVTNQLRVVGEATRIPDLVVYVNGIPLVVIEAKSPINPSQNTFDAIVQIRSAEREIPRLFVSNLFNIATNDVNLMYGATGAPSEYWSRWRDPWPRSAEEFADKSAQGMYSLLEPSRLLDLLAHFVVFETRDGKTVKKLCRYQQFRAVNKMVRRVVHEDHRSGLVWHTQGSGKSLTMVFAALKLKFHRGIASDRLKNPNLLILTDRVDLHEQISATFVACGLPNPTDAGSIAVLKGTIVPGAKGLTVLSTIFKFHWDDPRFKSKNAAERAAALAELEVPGSENWILMVDECHRTQEKDLGAYLKAILPHAVRFGFTGTPVKKDDLDTFQNFGAPGEAYLDKYGIEDAVRDGATVPILYTGRMTQWHLRDKELDSMFDHAFAGESDEMIAELIKRGVTKGDVARLKPRIRYIASDIWIHFRETALADGFKAQIVAVDRQACVAYKEALDAVIARYHVESLGHDEATAQALAEEMSVCIYSPGQHDADQKPELVRYQLDEKQTKEAIKAFKEPDTPLKFIIVCNKLLTGFDAPIEQVMYLDNPLTDHNLLQAIARTNRRYGATKEYGLVVDYVGISAKLGDALSAYRKEDVSGALRNHDLLADALKVAHREVMDLVRQVDWPSDPDKRVEVDGENVKAAVIAAIEHLGSEDRWYIFRAKADGFIRAYQALTPDPRVLTYQYDLKFVAACMPYGKMRFEQVEEIDWRRYSKKVQQMLAEHLKATGLVQVCKLRSITEPEFWQDFAKAPRTPEELKTAAVRKLAELKKETSERAAVNPARYARFSDRVKELIEKFNKGLIESAKVMEFSEGISGELAEEVKAHTGSGLNPRAYDVHAILETFAVVEGEDAEDGDDTSTEAGVEDAELKLGPTTDSDAEDAAGGDGGSDDDGADDEITPKLTKMELAAEQIDATYASDTSAPRLWQDRPQLRKELRREVAKIVRELGLPGWHKDVPHAVEQYALLHYRKE